MPTTTSSSPDSASQPEPTATDSVFDDFARVDSAASGDKAAAGGVSLELKEPSRSELRQDAPAVHSRFQTADIQPKEPQVRADDTTLPVARPFLDAVFHWAASVPLAVNACGQVLCCCRLRIFRNGALGRATEWAVLITELPQADDLLSHIARRHNPGAPARACLAEIADLVKAGYLLRAPHEQIAWFLHDAEQTSRERPLRHHRIQRVRFNVRDVSGKCIYIGFMRTPVAPEELELAAGGLVEL